MVWDIPSVPMILSIIGTVGTRIVWIFGIFPTPSFTGYFYLFLIRLSWIDNDCASGHLFLFCATASSCTSGCIRNVKPVHNILCKEGKTCTNIYRSRICTQEKSWTPEVIRLVEVEVLAADEFCGRASVPSGASTGRYEVVELRDGRQREKNLEKKPGIKHTKERYGGMGVELAVDHVNSRIAPAVIGMNVFDQAAVDEMLKKLDGTKDKSNLGANAMLGVSMAVARAAANSLGIPLYSYLGGVNVQMLPVPDDGKIL